MSSRHLSEAVNPEITDEVAAILERLRHAAYDKGFADAIDSCIELLEALKAEPETPPVPLDDPIDVLSLSARAYNALHREGITTLAELVNCTREELLQIRSFGPTSLDGVLTELRKLNLSLKD